MARIASACPREAHAAWHRLAAGWTALSNFLLGRARVEAAAFMPRDEKQPAATTLNLPRTENSGQAHVPVSRSPAGPSLAWIDLMAQMSHDLRTPLNAVIGFSDVMSAELLGPVGHPRYREYAGDIGESGRRLLKAAEDTLAMTALLTQSVRSAPQPVAIAPLVSELWTLHGRSGDGISLVLDTGDDLGLEILAPAQALRQVVRNLLSESHDRAPAGGRILVRAITEGDLVRIEVTVPCARPRPAIGPSLCMGLARTLLELQGAGLIEITGADGTWRAVTVLDRAVQQDFFSSIPSDRNWIAQPAMA